MKNVIKPICVIFAVVMLVLCVAGCGNSTSKEEETTESITTSSQAISAVKNYASGSPFGLEQRIASSLGFKNFYEPKFGTSDAVQNTDGSWTVTMKGSMSGYVDEYHNDFETYKFEVSATVSATGSVNIRVSKAK